jgi:hypothetical protein
VTVELATVVLTKNEEGNIGECLGSLQWADERFVIDDFSTDQTAEIARKSGAIVLEHPFQDFAAQRNAALTLVDAKWIFFVDADERATPALAAEVRHVTCSSAPDMAAPPVPGPALGHGQMDGEMAGWWVPRQNYMIGHRMRGGGWYPDYQLRLLRRGKARYDTARPVHEIVLLDGPAAHLENALIHYNYSSLAQFWQKMGRYTRLEAKILHERGVRVRPWTYFTMPAREFWRRFVALHGYRDHVYGLLFCGLMAWYTFVTYWRLRGLKAHTR